MDNSLKNLESKLEGLSPRGLSDATRESCHQLIDRLVAEADVSSKEPLQGSKAWIGTAAAAAVALSIGISGGWYFGKDKADSPITKIDQPVGSIVVAAFEPLDRESWVVTEQSPKVYVTKSGKIREISQEVEVTKELVQHRESGVVVTVETTDHHVVDGPKSDF